MAWSRWLSRTVRTVVAAGLVIVVPLATGVPTWAGDNAVAPAGTPSATDEREAIRVGPLFKGSITGSHHCTASVIASPNADLVLTAAHCLNGTGVGLQFAPSYRNGATPYGVWTVTAAFVDPHWLANHDPRYDYALLRMAPRKSGGTSTTIEQVTGGAFWGMAPWVGATVTDVAYNGDDDSAVSCSATVLYTDGFPGFHCHGFVGGSSGSPWLLTVAGVRLPVIVGVIGGPFHGGCYEHTSYSSPFRSDIYQLLRRASTATSGDSITSAGDNGC